MKDTRFYGPPIKKAIARLKKRGSVHWSETLVWDKLDREYEIWVRISLRKRRPTEC